MLIWHKKLETEFIEKLDQCSVINLIELDKVIVYYMITCLEQWISVSSSKCIRQTLTVGDKLRVTRFCKSRVVIRILKPMRMVLVNPKH